MFSNKFNKKFYQNKDELGEITSSWGVEVIKIELSDIKVIKEGENMALNLFNKVDSITDNFFNKN